MPAGPTGETHWTALLLRRVQFYGPEFNHTRPHRSGGFVLGSAHFDCQHAWNVLLTAAFAPPVSRRTSNLPKPHDNSTEARSKVANFGIRGESFQGIPKQFKNS